MKKIILGLVLSIISTISVAHVSFYPKSLPVGTTHALLTLNVPHGCYGSPVTSISIKSPTVGMYMHPAQKAGWRADIISRPLPKELIKMHEFGDHYSTETDTVTYQGILPEGLSDQFIVHLSLPKEPQVILFEVVQKCENGRIVKYTSENGKTTKEIAYEEPVKFEVK